MIDEPTTGPKRRRRYTTAAIRNKGDDPFKAVPCPRCYAPMARVETGYACVKHGPPPETQP